MTKYTVDSDERYPDYTISEPNGYGSYKEVELSPAFVKKFLQAQERYNNLSDQLYEALKEQRFVK